MEKQKVIIYIDGFNFYYGLRRKGWKRYYWLNIVKLFEQFIRDNQELVCIKYFSARSTDSKQGLRQNAFFQANKENPKFQLILGKYIKKEIRCFNCNDKRYTYEEKETDVRIATQIVADSYKKKCDIAIIVSADSDMIPAIELAQENGTKVFVYFPPDQWSNSLDLISNGKSIDLTKYESRFKKSLFEDIVILKRENKFPLNIPKEWKEHQEKSH
ncbi:NYN domain-containing protein [Bergeyella cardium]|uniref:NYN domain-containing protein n=1 Tax=Bergeyella cardium TaxID=1585976 RepID=A0A6P1QTE9_9FLAO|nr:NYN domain-containing protein [Bergeyella cardium]QHN65079.1 NYN domain-containing protein [Bergeyella cardium]WHE34394.1 NYN domain-containing protein [Bergeyella cardium]WHF61045.1 NYN domain-containing protein [Bergeyella cardium]